LLALLDLAAFSEQPAESPETLTFSAGQAIGSELPDWPADR